MHDSKRNLLLLSLLPVASALGRLECLYDRSTEFANTSPCGDVGALSYCLSHLDVLPNAIQSEVERCFTWAGCKPEESIAQAARVIGECDHPSNELRLRRKQQDTAAAEARAVGVNNLDRREALPLITGVPHQPRADPTPTGSPGQCFSQESTSTTVCPIITTGTLSGRRGECTPTVLVNEKCIDGLICAADARGNVSCMYKHSSLDLAGIILAIIFASAIVISIVSICFLCCRERANQRKIARQKEAEKIAKEAKATAAAKRPGANVTAQPNLEGQPLMHQGVPNAPAGGAYPPQGGYPPQGQGPYGGQNPFA